jgi:hypothetical protein
MHVADASERQEAAVDQGAGDLRCPAAAIDGNHAAGGVEERVGGRQDALPVAARGPQHDRPGIVGARGRGQEGVVEVVVAGHPQGDGGRGVVQQDVAAADHLNDDGSVTPGPT